MAEWWETDEPVKQTSQAPSRDEWWAQDAPVKQQQQQQEQPEAEGALATGVRHLVHALPTIATMAGTGALYGALGGPGGAIGGAIAGGVAGAAEAYGQRKLTEEVAPEEAARLRAGEEAHPYAALTGELAAAGPFFGVRGATMATRGAMAAGMGVLDAGQELALKGQIDPAQVALSAAGGAVFGGPPTRLGRAVMGAGEQAAARIRPTVAEAPTVPVGEAPVAETAGQAVPHGTAGPQTHSNVAETPIPTHDQIVSEPQNQPPRTGPGPEETTKPDYGEMLEQEFPRVQPREGVTVGVDPAQVAALQQQIPPGLEARYPGVARYIEQRYPEQAAAARQQQFQQQQQRQPPAVPPEEATQAVLTRPMTAEEE